MQRSCVISCVEVSIIISCGGSELAMQRFCLPTILAYLYTRFPVHKRMFNNLKQKYHFNNNFKHNLRTIILVSMGFMLLVLYFQPFGINFMVSSRDGYFVLAMGMVSALVLAFSTLILPGFFPDLFDSDKWTIKKELIWNAGIFAALIGGFAFVAFIFEVEGMQTLTLFRSGALSLLPLILFNLLNYNHSLKAKFVKALDNGRHWFHEDIAKPQIPENQSFSMLSDNGKDVFRQELKNIILIQSASNYIEIFYRDDKSVKRRVLRKTLQSAAEVIKEYQTLIKCHRCCLVNTSQVSRLISKSSSFYLEVEGLGFGIPLSRDKVAFFRKLLSPKTC